MHVGVHPCFCGGFADRGDPAAVLVRPGYLDGHWTKESWTDQGIPRQSRGDAPAVASIAERVPRRRSDFRAVRRDRGPAPDRAGGSRGEPLIRMRAAGKIFTLAIVIQHQLYL
ncbi:hypothetical protein GCM10027360_35050 [Amycolatopsis echigonensis]